MASNSNPALHVSHTTHTSHPGLGWLCLRLAHPLLPSLDASRRTSPEEGERRAKGCERASSEVDVEEWATQAHLAVWVHDMDSGYEGCECLIYLCACLTSILLVYHKYRRHLVSPESGCRQTKQNCQVDNEVDTSTTKVFPMIFLVTQPCPSPQNRTDMVDSHSHSH
jgi:hypothetical protein